MVLTCGEAKTRPKYILLAIHDWELALLWYKESLKAQKDSNRVFSAFEPPTTPPSKTPSQEEYVTRGPVGDIREVAA